MNKTIVGAIAIIILIAFLWWSGLFAGGWEEPVDPPSGNLGGTWQHTITITTSDGQKYTFSDDAGARQGTIYYGEYIITHIQYCIKVKPSNKGSYTFTETDIDKSGFSVKDHIKRADGSAISGSLNQNPLSGIVNVPISGSYTNLACAQRNLAQDEINLGLEGQYTVEFWVEGTASYTLPEIGSSQSFDLPAPTAVTAVTFLAGTGGFLNFDWQFGSDAITP